MRPNHRSLIVLLLLTLGVAGATGNAADERSISPSPDTASLPPVPLPVSDTSGSAIEPRPDSPATTPGDSVRVDSVVLEPQMYHFGSDTILINSFAAPRPDSSRGPSPTLTMFKSVVFPGWGQAANRKYLKAALVFALETYFISRAIDFAGKASDWRKIWKATPASLATAKEAAFRQYADYRDSRNSNLWGTAITIFLSMFDAYVDAHLRTFPHRIPQEIPLSLTISGGRETVAAVQFRF